MHGNSNISMPEKLILVNVCSFAFLALSTSIFNVSRTIFSNSVPLISHNSTFSGNINGNSYGSGLWSGIPSIRVLYKPGALVVPKART